LNSLFPRAKHTQNYALEHQPPGFFSIRSAFPSKFQHCSPAVVFFYMKRGKISSREFWIPRENVPHVHVYAAFGRSSWYLKKNALWNNKKDQLKRITLSVNAARIALPSHDSTRSGESARSKAASRTRPSVRRRLPSLQYIATAPPHPMIIASNTKSEEIAPDPKVTFNTSGKLWF
jgi:hypothetical protein